MDRALEFLQEENGNFSSSRLILMLWAVGVLIAWIALSFSAGSLQSIDNSVAAILGILTSGKVVQRFGETSSQSGGAE